MILRLLSSGYWHARFSANQFIQWPQGRAPLEEDGFGWLTWQHFHEAGAGADRAERRPRPAPVVSWL